MTLRNFIIGAETLAAWFGSGLETVSQDRATMRAMTCKLCPMNQKAKWHERWPEYFTTLSGIRETLRKNGCQTSLDPHLHTCSGCDCPLTIKIWCPLPVIKLNMPVELRAKLHPQCWITNE